ncbi:MAG: hypothetical protein WA228_06100 [Desulfobaccales bacterium]
MMADHQKSSDELLRRKPLWVRGIVLVFGFVLISSLFWYFLKGRLYPPIHSQGEPVPQAQTQPSPKATPNYRVAPTAREESTALLKGQLQKVISEIREANQKKDLSKFLSYYSPNFPGLTQRTQSISKMWKIFDYPQIEFNIEDIKLLPDNTVLARVKWEAEAKNICTQKSNNVSKTYLVKFGKESGQWRIKSLEEVN